MTPRPRIAFLVAQLEFDGTYPDLLVKAALEAADRLGFDLLVVPGREWGSSLDQEGIHTAVYRLLASWPLDAVVVSPPVMNRGGEADLVRAARWLDPLPAVVMATAVGDRPRVDLDHDQGLGDLLDHLIGTHGYRRIACLRGPRGNAVAEARFGVWRAKLAEAGLDHGAALVEEVEFKEEGVAEAVEVLLARVGTPDALVAVSDLVALAAVRALQARGLRVPEDVAVVGFDDLPLAAEASPPLTTVWGGIDAQVDGAFALALALAEGREVGPGRRVSTALVVRRSCGCPGAPAARDPGNRSATPGVVHLQRRLERLATFNLGMGSRPVEAEFHRWLAGQLRHHGFSDSLLALVRGPGVGHHEPVTDPRDDLPEPPSTWEFPLGGRSFDGLWGQSRRRVALPLASGHHWFGLLFLDLDPDGALVYRGIQEALTRRSRERYERQVLLARNIEEEMATRVEQEKMQSLSRLVAGVAHEVNTPLGNAITAASFLDAAFQDGVAGKAVDVPVLTEAFRLLRQNLERAADLVSRFKRVSVELAQEPGEPADLAVFLTDLMPSLAFPLRQAGIDLTFDLAPQMLSSAPTKTLFDIFTNLVQNVLDHAYPEGGPGKVHIEGRRTRGEGVVLTFRDGGRGMDEATRKMVFEPFFTTRRSQGGTGLGLHIVFNQVTRQLNGRISCQSTPGEGTAFRIELPGPIDSGPAVR